MKTGESTPGHIFNTNNNPEKKTHVRYSTCRHRPQANGSKYATHGYVWAIQFTTHLPFAEFRGSSYESWLLILDKRPTEITYMTLGPGDMEGQTFCRPKNFRNILRSVLFDILVNKHGNSRTVFVYQPVLHLTFHASRQAFRNYSHAATLLFSASSSRDLLFKLDQS